MQLSDVASGSLVDREVITIHYGPDMIHFCHRLSMSDTVEKRDVC